MWLEEIRTLKGDECPPVILLYKRPESYASEKEAHFVEKGLNEKATRMGFDGFRVSDGVGLADDVCLLSAGGEFQARSPMGDASECCVQ